MDEAFQAIQIIYRVEISGGELRDEAGWLHRLAARWFSREEAAAIASR